MKRLLLTLITLLPTAALADEPLRRTVQSSGESIVYVQPDEVELRFEIHAFDKDLGKAKSTADAQSAAVIQLITSMGAAEKDIQTERMRADAVYDERNVEGRMMRGELRGYSVGRSYAVVLKDVTKFEPLSDALLVNPEVTFGQYNFRTSELRKHRDAARIEALKAAREKAAAMAAALDCSVGAPVTITETGGGPRPMLANSFASMDRAGGDDSAVKLGQIAIQSSVDVVFDLLPK